MGQAPSMFTEKDKEEIIANMEKNRNKNVIPIQGVKIKRIEKPNKYEPASVFSDTQQAEMNRIQNEQGGKELCRGDECDPNVLPVINPSE